MNYICPFSKKKVYFLKTPLLELGLSFCTYWQLKRSWWLMTWGLNSRTSATWGGGGLWGWGRRANAPTLLPQEHFSCSQHFKRSLYELLIFTFYSRSLMLCKCEVPDNKQLSKVSRMFCKVHCFCFLRAGLSAFSISLLHSPSSSLLIG